MTRPVHRRVLVAAVGAIVSALVISACSGSNSPKTVASSASGSVGSGGPATLGGGFGRPAASGIIAAVDLADIQVQDPTAGQTTVNFTAQTRFTETKATTRAGLKVGACIVASSAVGSTDVQTVTISAPRNGQCAGFVGRPTNGGSFPSGFPSGAQRSFPSGAPRSLPSGVPGGGRVMVGSVVFGKVTALSGNTMTVAAETRGSTQGSPPTTQPKTLALTATTKYEVTGVATKAALKVGKCASAQGKTDSTGAVSATSIAITPATGGQCTTTFGRRFVGGGNG